MSENTDEQRLARESVEDTARRARQASIILSRLTTSEKNDVLLSVADALEEKQSQVLDANLRDIDRGRESGMSDGLLDRLALDANRISGIASGLRQVATLPDPIGEVVQGSTLPNGLRLRQVRVPLGVMGMVYEARPNVTVDAFGLAWKSGNAVVLRGSKSAYESNRALVRVIHDVLAAKNLPVDAVSLLSATDHSSVTHLIQARGLVDVVIPRGGAGLINAVVANATVPTIETGTGNCHVFIDRHADVDMAISLVLNGKTRRPSVCNATETVLIDTALGEENIERVLESLRHLGVSIHGDRPGMIPATDADWGEEYLSMDIAVAVVDGIDAAIEHINRWGSGHTEAIVTADLAAAEEFSSHVDAAAVMVNTSTAFTDGEQFGLGAEMGISTQKLHARGPMGLQELTSTKWVVWGNGQVRP